MTEEYESPMMEGESLSWSETWIDALTKPSEETYVQIAADPGASPRRAYTWIAIASFISFSISIFLSGLFAVGAGGGDALGGLMITLVCGAIFVPIFSILALMIFTGITQAIAGALGGTGSYGKLVYANAAYQAPLSLVSTGLSIIPIVSLLTIPLLFYGIVLNVIAVKAVNQFSWGKALASSIAILFGLLIIGAILVVVVLALLGPAIGNIFEEIMAGL